MVLPPAAGVPLVSVVSKELRTHWVNLLEMGSISTLKKKKERTPFVEGPRIDLVWGIFQWEQKHSRQSP